MIFIILLSQCLQTRQVWNFLSGECLKTLIDSKEANEITGLIHLPDKKQFLSIGWDKKITTFPDIPDVSGL